MDAWAKEVIEDMMVPEKETSPCSERWENMKNDLVASMWSIFDEAGIFLSLCRHGFVLVASDMVQSGEL